ncbi:cofactor-independent phosphoglycerate mutase [Methanogenium marinum]|uniref:phosphoglycerate mutase (2,3-diphosphoglycerate-independent) n=1 Tax=Methanogenium marinum TaxID=348610 RepID=A0A9Q4KU61_9EURY|nr:cofactor-independent phosphoglycerate mutase [Methanogenium marinum]MDE4908911.1 cofactor-independent phosphoglycerate mutase [Methanogenium marinum]
MKYLIILGDGMADWPCESLNNMTPLAYADIPNMDRIARIGRSGMLKTVKDGFEPGSDIANLSVLGYDPALYYTGRGALEAVSMGVDLGPDDIAYRCNLVTVNDGVMHDFSAGHITSEEGAALLASLDAALSGVSVYPGVSYRNLLVVPGGAGAETKPPHDIVDEKIVGYLPTGGDASLLEECVRVSREVFADHPVNRKRIADGKVPATQIWPWSGGKKPQLPSFEERYGVRGAMISAVDLLNGIARCAGMDVITVPGATGYLDTDYMAKARYAVAALEKADLVYMHVEAPDEAGHLGSAEEKVRAIERLDEAVGYILDHVDGVIALLPDHPTPLALKTHTSDPVPFAVIGKGTDDVDSYSETAAEKGSFGLMDALDFILMLTKNKE